MLYSETKNKETFDWNKFLDKESYTLQELQNARSLSNNWITCACGNQCNIIPRDYQGKPEDLELIKLGNRFYKCIHLMHDYHFNKDKLYQYQCEANSVLEDIEKRSLYLITLINAGHKSRNL